MRRSKKPAPAETEDDENEAQLPAPKEAARRGRKAAAAVKVESADENEPANKEVDSDGEAVQEPPEKVRKPRVTRAKAESTTTDVAVPTAKRGRKAAKGQGTDDVSENSYGGKDPVPTSRPARGRKAKSARAPILGENDDHHDEDYDDDIAPGVEAKPAPKKRGRKA